MVGNVALPACEGNCEIGPRERPSDVTGRLVPVAEAEVGGPLMLRTCHKERVRLSRLAGRKWAIGRRAHVALSLVPTQRRSPNVAWRGQRRGSA